MKEKNIDLHFLGNIFGCPVYVDMSQRPPEDRQLWVLRAQTALGKSMVDDVAGLRKLADDIENYNVRNPKAKG